MYRLGLFSWRLATQPNYLSINMQCRVPGNRNSILDTLVGWATFRVYMKCAFSRSTRLCWDRQIIMNSNRLNTDRFANTHNPTIDGGGIELTIKRNFAP